MKKSFITIVILAIIIGGVWWFGKKAAAPVSPVVTTTSNIAVSNEAPADSVGKTATFGTMVASIVERDGKSLLVLSRGGTENIIDSVVSSTTELVQAKKFGEVSFSPKGDYLLTQVYGWEIAWIRIYDISSKKLVLTTESGDGAFNSSESLFYFCVQNDFSGYTAADIYNVPGFNKKTDLLKKFPELDPQKYYYSTVTCSANEADHVLRFEFSGGRDRSGLANSTPPETVYRKTYNFNLETGEFINSI